MLLAKKSNKIYITCSMRAALVYIALIGAIFIYTTSGVFSKLASQQDFASLPYVAAVCGAVAVLGIYAVLWQQIIKRMPVGDAYLFKGTGVIFGLALAHFVFGEAITLYNIVGAGIIIAGITLNARS